jgi:hypothetical protein
VLFQREMPAATATYRKKGLAVGRDDIHGSAGVNLSNAGPRDTLQQLLQHRDRYFDGIGIVLADVETCKEKRKESTASAAQPSSQGRGRGLTPRKRWSVWEMKSKTAALTRIRPYCTLQP